MEEKLILFQGDSITDCSRDRESDLNIGRGYAHLVQAHLMAQEPYCYRFLNRGISGNRIVDLYDRMDRDMIDLKPDYMSILIGINGVWHEYAYRNGVSVRQFEEVYDRMVGRLHESLPELKLMILEPFVLPGTVTRSDAEHPGRWEYFRTQCDLRRIMARKIADRYEAVFVPLQKLFDRRNDGAPDGYWLHDGVHPSPAGHELIKLEWLKGFERLK